MTKIFKSPQLSELRKGNRHRSGVRARALSGSRTQEILPALNNWLSQVALLILLAGVAYFAWVLYAYLQQARVDPILNLSPIGGLNYRLDVTKFNPEFLEAQVEVTPYWQELGALTNEDFVKCGSPDPMKPMFAPLQMTDMSSDFDSFGIASVQGRLRNILKRPEFSSKQPGKYTQQFKMLGKPYLYPFDEYLIVGSVIGEVHLDCDSINKGFSPRVSEGGFSYAMHLPYMTLRGISGRDFKDWPTEGKSWAKNPMARSMIEGSVKMERALGLAGPDEYNDALWEKNRFAIVLERPLFLRQLTIALFLIALTSVVFVAYTTSLDSWAPNIAGIFLTIWAIRSILGSTAPSLPTLMDLGSLVMYLLGISILLIRLINRKKSARK
ncbi:MAG: hypothetical protein JWM43_623 [Acidobacteriaceae bacterium]|nr:hypothetical protein [Acidobacteriaceae bacterium]